MSSDSSIESTKQPFCHTFDLTKRLPYPNDDIVNCVPIPHASRDIIFDTIITNIEQSILKTASNFLHRIIIPTILSPALYPDSASRPEHILRFLHALRALLCRHSHRATAMITLPLELHPRHSALTRWAEHFCDGAFELAPFPHSMEVSGSLAEPGGARTGDDQPQGMVKILKLPITTERGEGGAGPNNSLGQDLAFTLSRRKFVITQFSLPPL